MRLILLATMAATCLSAALDAAEPKKQKSSDARELQDLPATLRIKQRTTATVPGSAGKLQLTADDITRGQVILSLSHAKHGVLLGPTSMRPEDAKGFQLGSESYQLRLKELSNALIGDDFAEVEIALPPDASVEKRRVEKLIADVEGMKDAAFIHGGREITPKEEADAYCEPSGRNWPATLRRPRNSSRLLIRARRSKESRTSCDYPIKRSCRREPICSTNFTRGEANDAQRK